MLRLLLLVVPLQAAGRPARACDLCAVYTATELRESTPGFRLGVAEQYSHFGILKRDGHEVPNDAGERVDSAITQLLAAYRFGPVVGVQLSLPVISRTFRRLEDGRIRHGDESGIGDMTLTTLVTPVHLIWTRSVLRFSLLAGLKLPTGDTDRLGEELARPTPAGAAVRLRPRHSTGGGGNEDPDAHHAESGVHGHDLTLGSGSVDGIVGAQLFWSFDKWFLTAAGQYAVRGTGDFDYRYANDLLWSGGPGWFALLEHEHALALQVVFSGETKGKDTAAGETLDDTGITALYLGPGVTFTWGTSLAADVALDLPVRQETTDLQIVPDFRLRGGVTWRF